MPLAGSGESSQSLVEQTPMAVKTPANLYDDCASPAAAFYGESSTSYHNHELLLSSSPFFGSNTGFAVPHVAEQEQLCAAAAQQMPQQRFLPAFVNSQSSTPREEEGQQQQVEVQQQQQQQEQQQQQLMIPMMVVPQAAQPYLQQQQPQQQQQQQTWVALPLTTVCGRQENNSLGLCVDAQQQQGGSSGLLPAANMVIMSGQQQPGCMGLGPQQQLQQLPQQQAAGTTAFACQMTAPALPMSGGIMPPLPQQQQLGQSNVVSELRQEAVGSLFLHGLLEAAEIVKDEERLLAQLSERQSAGRRKPAPTTAHRSRVDAALGDLRQRHEQVAWRLKAAAEEPGAQQKALEAVLPRCRRTATDALGRHVLEKFFELGSAESRSRLAQEGLGKGVLRLALHQHGCHVIQAALETVALADAQMSLVAELRGHVWDLIESPHGNHVLQKLLQSLPAPCLGFVALECLPRATELATHAYGCRVLQRLIEHYPLWSEPMESMLGMLFANFAALATDSFGNYVLQHLLEHGRTQDRLLILRKLQPDVESYATHRCASNLVQKALKCEEAMLAVGAACTTPALACAVLGEGVDPARTPAPIVALAQDKYGNHILQWMLTHSSVFVRELTAGRLEQKRHELQEGVGAKYAKHVLIALDGAFPPCSAAGVLAVARAG